ncbi:hypothetical protein IL306_014888, partial [Fusarium sp. DS 682]
MARTRELQQQSIGTHLDCPAHPVRLRVLPEAGRRRRNPRSAGSNVQEVLSADGGDTFRTCTAMEAIFFAASRTSLTKHQARWSLDGETVDYMGTKLQMEQVTQLVESEFRQAHSLL